MACDAKALALAFHTGVKFFPNLLGIAGKLAFAAWVSYRQDFCSLKLQQEAWQHVQTAGRRSLLTSDPVRQKDRKDMTSPLRCLADEAS